VNSPAEEQLIEERLKNQELKKQIAELKAVVAAHEMMRVLRIKMTDTPQSVIEILNTDFKDLV